PGPVAGQVELVLVQARGGGPATAGGEADREGGGAPLRGGGAGRGLVPPGVQQAAGSGAEGGGDGADLAVDDPADQRRGARAGGPAAGGRRGRGRSGRSRGPSRPGTGAARRSRSRPPVPRRGPGRGGERAGRSWGELPAALMLWLPLPGGPLC